MYGRMNGCMDDAWMVIVMVMSCQSRGSGNACRDVWYV